MRVVLVLSRVLVRPDANQANSMLKQYQMQSVCCVSAPLGGAPRSESQSVLLLPLFVFSLVSFRLQANWEPAASEQSDGESID